MTRAQIVDRGSVAALEWPRDVRRLPEVREEGDQHRAARRRQVRDLEKSEEDVELGEVQESVNLKDVAKSFAISI